MESLLCASPPNPLSLVAPISYHVGIMGLFVTVLVRILEGMFIVGWAGTVLVLVLSGIEDLETLFGKEDETHS